MTRKAWNDYTYEGILIRRIIMKLEKELANADLDETLRILNAIQQASTASTKLDFHTALKDKVNLVLKLYAAQLPKKMLNNYAKVLTPE